MEDKVTVVSHLYIKANGQELSDEVLGRITEVVVDQHAYLPGMFAIRLYDADLTLLDKGQPFNLATAVEILSRPPNGEPISLIKGEVTSLEPHFGEGMIAELVVRGYDLAHRLYRELKSKTYLNIKDSDLATQFAGASKLKSNAIETTSTVYAHLYQHNQSDLQFLMQRAWRIGYECFIDGDQLVFRRPVAKQAKVKLTWGADLLSFAPRMTVAEQVEEVLVKGWDVQKKAAITGKAAQGRLYAQIEEPRDGKGWSQALHTGSKLVIVDQPVISQAEADVLAAARLDEISGVFVEAEGSAFRRPDIRAGQAVKLEGLGKRFSGLYLVTRATHLYTSAGFSTTFAVSGTRLGLISEALHQRSPLDRWPGVAPAIVTNTDDPQGWGRVKVKFPWLADKEESDWARVLGSGAGDQAGFCTIPAVDDEVLVAFVQGDFGSPVVLGSLWNGQDALPAPVADAPTGEKPQVRSWHTPKGHHITLYDNADNKLEIVTAGGHQAVLDDAQRKVEVVTTGGHKLTLDDQGQQITLTSTGGLSITLDDKGAQITLNAAANITLKAGATLALQATTLSLSATTLSLSASSLAMSGDGSIELSAGGPVAIKGATVALN